MSNTLRTKKGILIISTDKMSAKTIVYNTAHNKLFLFYITVILWVYGKKVVAEALVNSDATSNFINKR